MSYSEEEVFAKADQLSDKYKTKVYPLVVTVPKISLSVMATNGSEPLKEETGEEKIVGYIKEPSRQAKMAALDKTAIEGSITLGGEMILNACLIKEESDPRIFSTASEYDAIYIGACMQCNKLVQAYSAELKKK